MKRITLILALCVSLSAFSQTGGGTTTGGGTGGTGGTVGGTAGTAGSSTIYGSGSGSPAVNTVGNPLNQYQSGTLPGSPSRAGMAPVRPGLPGSPATTTTTITTPAGGSVGTFDTSQGSSSGFTNQLGSTRATNSLANNNVPFALGGAGLDSTELQEMLSVLRNNIQQILPALDAYNRNLLSGGTAGVGNSTAAGANIMEMNAGSGGATIMSGTGTGGGKRAGSTGSGANLSTSAAGNFSRDTSGNAGANVSTPAGGSITGNRGSATGSAAGGGATVSGGSGSAASTTASDPNNLMTTSRGGLSGRLSPTGASDPYSGYPTSSGTGVRGGAGTESEIESMVLLEADLQRTLALLNSLNVPDLASSTNAAGGATTPQGTIRGAGSRVQPPGALLPYAPRQSRTTSTPVTTPPAGVNR